MILPFKSGAEIREALEGLLRNADSMKRYDLMYQVQHINTSLIWLRDKLVVTHAELLKQKP